MLTETASDGEKPEQKNTLEVVKKLGQGVLNFPSGPPLTSYATLLVTNPGNLLVWDAAGQQPLYILDVKNGTIEGYSDWGKGPGEMEPSMPKSIYKTDDYIYVLEVMNHMLHRFTHDLEYVTTLDIMPDDTMYGQSIVVDDSTFLYRSEFQSPNEESNAYFRIIELDSSGNVKETGSLLDYDLVPEFSPMRHNAVLKQGPMLAHDDVIFAGSLFGSMIIGINEENNIVFSTTSPDDIGIPETEVRMVNGMMVGEPESAVITNLDMTAYGDYLYVLYSGEKSTYDQVSSYMMEGDLEEDMRIGEAQLLRVYDISDSSLKAEFKLPEWSSAIAVDEQYLYSVVWEEEPYIMVMSRPYHNH